MKPSSFASLHPADRSVDLGHAVVVAELGMEVLLTLAVVDEPAEMLNHTRPMPSSPFPPPRSPGFSWRRMRSRRGRPSAPVRVPRYSAPCARAASSMKTRFLSSQTPLITPASFSDSSRNTAALNTTRYEFRECRMYTHVYAMRVPAIVSGYIVDRWRLLPLVIVS